MKLLSKIDADIIEILESIMDNLMTGSSEIDHAKHTQDFSARIKHHLSPEQLAQICNDYQSRWGHFTTREFVYLFRRADSIAVVWKQHVSKIPDELVAEAVFKEENGRIVVDHAFVF